MTFLAHLDLHADLELLDITLARMIKLQQFRLGDNPYAASGFDAEDSQPNSGGISSVEMTRCYWANGNGREILLMWAARSGSLRHCLLLPF